jgi:ankyrin repeat protein
MDAVGNNDIKEARRLLNIGIDPNTPDAFGYRPLDGAMTSEMVYLLNRYGAQINQPNKFSDTPLHTAVYNCFPEVVEALLEIGADPSIENQNNDTPLSMARKAVEKGSFLNGSRTTKDITTDEERDQYKRILEILNEWSV